MHLFIPSAALLAAVAAVHLGLPLPLPGELAVLGMVALAQTVQAAYYEQRLREARALLHEALATLQETDESHQSAGASAQD